MENDTFLNFVVNKEKRRDTFLKKLLDSNNMSKEMSKSIKLIVTRTGTIYCFCKVHKQEVDVCPHPFKHFLLALCTPTCNRTKVT